MSDYIFGEGKAEDATVVVGDQPVPVEGDSDDAERLVRALERRVEKLQGHLDIAEAALEAARADLAGGK